MSDQQYDNTNRFALFRNEKRNGDKDPEYTASTNVEGVEYFLDAWVKESKAGKKFFSGKIKRKEKQP